VEADRCVSRAKDAELRVDAAQQQNRADSTRHELELEHWQQRYAEATQRVNDSEARIAELQRVQEEWERRAEEGDRKRENGKEPQLHIAENGTNHKDDDDIIMDDTVKSEGNEGEEERENAEAMALRAELEEMERVVVKMESERTKDKTEMEKLDKSLEEMMRKYEEGVEQIRKLEEQLSRSEQNHLPTSPISVNQVVLREDDKLPEKEMEGKNFNELKENAEGLQRALDAALEEITQLRAEKEAAEFTQRVTANDMADSEAQTDAVATEVKDESDAKIEEPETAEIEKPKKFDEEEIEEIEKIVRERTAVLRAEIEKLRAEIESLREELANIPAGFSPFSLSPFSFPFSLLLTFYYI
jgi:hypothetical protein